MFMLVMIVDASFVFHGKTQALRALQDSNRAFAVGRFATTSELKAAALVELNKFSPNASVTSTTNAGIVTTVATFPAKDLMSIGSISAISDVNVTVVSKQYIES